MIINELRELRRYYPNAFIRYHPSNKYILTFSNKSGTVYEKYLDSLELAKAIRNLKYWKLRARKIISPYSKLLPSYENIRKTNKYGKIGVSRNMVNHPHRTEIQYVSQWVEYCWENNQIKKKYKRKTFTVGRKRSETKALNDAIQHRKNIEKYLNTRHHKELRFTYLKRKS